ncbi:hypothetical protein [Paenibacillus glucanolyticus]|uniref:hypothetical protein n=1 Tax=Paenibacillus glucanolyticus TaxID=59843 RepID=UPI0009700A70|nr:hypothetical protein [Paenibacillus glucanolyticus]OMF73014.1 hypothetical protein BK142_19280 [Paenibacillus glucanolyticus]
MDTEGKEQPPLNLDSCNVILDTAKTVYNEEYDRFKQIETKTGVTIGFVGVLFGFIITYLTTIKLGNNDAGYLIYTFGIRFVIVTLLAISALKYLGAIKVGKFEQIDIDEVVDTRLASRPPEELTLTIAATYLKVIKENEEKINQKTDKYNDGLKLMVSGFLLFLIYFFLEEVIKYV